MSLINEILNDPFYRALADKVSDENREALDESVRDLLKHAEQIHAMILDAQSSLEKSEELAAAVEHNISPEGVGSWQERS